MRRVVLGPIFAQFLCCLLLGLLTLICNLLRISSYPCVLLLGLQLALICALLVHHIILWEESYVAHIKSARLLYCVGVTANSIVKVR